MPIIACAGQKGGSGKSTVAINVSAELVEQGLSVLLVDADPQGSARTWGDVAAEQGHKGPTVISMGAGLHKPDQLPQLSQAFDWTIIDCPPRHGDIQRAALMVSDLAVLPSGPSAPDVWALGESVDLVKSAQTFRSGLVARILLTRIQSRTALGREARDALNKIGIDLLDASLGFRVGYQEAPATGQGITKYQPGSEAAGEIRALVEEIKELTRGKAHGS